MIDRDKTPENEAQSSSQSSGADLAEDLAAIGRQTDNLFPVQKQKDRLVPRSAIPTAESDAVISGLSERREVRRRAVIEAVPSHEQGLDTARVDAFFRAQGLTPQPHIVVAEADRPAFSQAVQAVGLNAPPGDKDGVYFGAVEAIAVFRNEALEELNGPLLTEGVLVHEKAHSTDRYGDNLTYEETLNGISYETPRTGHLVDKHGNTEGSYYEEAFAELMRQKYLREAAGRQQGLIPEKGRSISFGDSIQLPIKYAYVVEDGKGAAPNGAIAAYGMEQLINRDPGIFNAMIAARGSADGLREVAKRIDAIQPGLYVKLRKLSYDAADFFEGTGHIIDTLHAGDEEAPLVVSEKAAY